MLFEQPGVEGVRVLAERVQVVLFAMGQVGDQFADTDLADDGVIGGLVDPIVIAQMSERGHDVGFSGRLDPAVCSQHAGEKRGAGARGSDDEDELFLHAWILRLSRKRPGLLRTILTGSDGSSPLRRAGGTGRLNLQAQPTDGPGRLLYDVAEGVGVGMRTQDWAIAGMLALVLAPGVAVLAEIWMSVPYYSHGFLIPFVALWAASSKRRVLPLLESGWDGRGAWALALALFGYLLGWLGGLITLVGISMVGAVAGGVWLLRGRLWLKTLSFPIGYLLFMVPIPDTWLAALTGQLQLWVSEVGTAILQLMGESVLRRGNVIELPGGGQLFVAEACSGITSLLTLLALGTILAYFTERRVVRRVLMVLSVIPVALLGNLVRVVLTVEWAQRVGVAAAADSAIHDWVGVGTYISACLVMLGISGLFRRFDRPLIEPSSAS